MIVTLLHGASAAGLATLTKAGTTLNFGQVANVEVTFVGSTWIGALKVTALEKAPLSDYKALGIGDNKGSVYYLRYDVTYRSGNPKQPPRGGDFLFLTPLGARGQSLDRINPQGLKQGVRPKCTTESYLASGAMDQDKDELVVGETATNMCTLWVVNKGTLTQVVLSHFDFDEGRMEITWK